MSRNTILAMTTMSFVSLGLALATSDAVAQQKSIKDQLVGTWTVVSWDQVRADGSKIQQQDPAVWRKSEGHQCV
jgi:hypothetical protein